MAPLPLSSKHSIHTLETPSYSTHLVDKADLIITSHLISSPPPPLSTLSFLT